MRRARRQVTDEAAGASEADKTSPLKIGEVARRAGIGVETLRFYERSGLLDRPARTEGGYRLYDAGALKTLEFIKRAQSLGFTLEEIKRIIAESRAGQRPCAEVRETVRRRLAELDQQMAQIRRYRNALAATLKQWDEKGFADGDFCGLIESSDLSAMKPERNNLKRRGK
ncbi:MAG TPA: heavy metal-responsive transcriptional regulator [Blastocatellia bacterium]|jgi:DNA-binding transcriptional MerR regulator|nr:heavy metal-responsive transcriptional regulator [Blastocatellia bacterium]